VANIAKQVRGIGITVPLLGGDGWEGVMDLNAAALEGAYYSCHYAVDEPRPEVRAFVDKYTKKYGKSPDSMSALGYDAMMLLKASAERAATLDRKGVREALASTKDFHGVTGVITMDEKRNAKKPAVVLQIKGKSTVTAASIAP